MSEKRDFNNHLTNKHRKLFSISDIRFAYSCHLISNESLSWFFDLLGSISCFVKILNQAKRHLKSFQNSEKIINTKFNGNEIAEDHDKTVPQLWHSRKMCTTTLACMTIDP